MGCGLEVVNYLSPPSNSYNTPTQTTGYDRCYFDFETNEEQSSAGYTGTAVYYKIYNNYSTMASRNSSIDSLASSTNETAAAKQMIETYGYKELGTNNGTKSPLIGATSTNQRVYIRLTNYYENTGKDFIAEIKYRNSSSSTSEWNYIGVPLRTGNRQTFDFARKEDQIADNSSVSSALTIAGAGTVVKNAVPTEDEATSVGDVVYGTFSDADKNVWYVDMYAVAVGQDEYLTTFYSKVLHLGWVPIDASDDNN
ncbi:MAG: hypothetical protein K2M99_08490 [Treponemataceae bacterium]|nr:hypothetical protein [Treponemataceae bacterium]